MEVLTIKELAEIAKERGWKLRQKELSFLKKMEEKEGSVVISVDVERLTERGFHQEMGKALVTYLCASLYEPC